MSINRKTFCLFCLGVLLSLPALAAQGQARRPWRVEWQPAQLVNGAPVLFRVTPPRPLASLRGTWLDHELAFRYGDSCSCWYALAGVGLSTKPGAYPLELAGATETEGKVRISHQVPVRAARYPSTALKVAPEFVEPPKETLERIEQDQEFKKQAFAHSAPESLWMGRFAAPAEASVSGVFGSARVFNGVKRSQHSGLDFRVTTGTPVAASNAGTVIVARSLYFEGNCVVLDHGQGLMTLYMHLSEIKVKEGDKVERGQLLGLSGGTGRATAPHLHFALRWQGVYLDPGTLLKLTPP